MSASRAKGVDFKEPHGWKKACQLPVEVYKATQHFRGTNGIEFTFKRSYRLIAYG